MNKNIKRALGIGTMSFLLLGISGCELHSNTENEATMEVVHTLPSILDETERTTVDSAMTMAPETTSAESVTKEAPKEVLVQVEPSDYVNVKDYLPDAVVELRYATENNFTKERIYDFSDAYLQYGTVLKLIQVQEDLAKDGYTLKFWDTYRPYEAQCRLWEVYPNGAYVANPAKGPTGHCNGRTMDITLVDLATGEELEMPSEFDDFSVRADRNYEDVSEEAAKNAQYLEDVMSRYGFQGYEGEWWDYTDQDSYGGSVEFVPPYDTTMENWQEDTLVEDLEVSKEVSQVMIVSVDDTTGSATFSMHTKDCNGSWKEIVSAPATVGKNGIGVTTEGNPVTPVGCYGFIKAFGVLPSPGTRMEYTLLDDSMYWIGNSDSEYYNQFISLNEVST